MSVEGQQSQSRPGSRSQVFRSLFFGGILPVIAFTVIEEVFGTVWGLIAGMVFGIGEILYEWRKEGRVQSLTWAGNSMIIVLGVVSLVTQKGVWFKLQPAILEGVMAMVLIGSALLGRPLLGLLAERQGIFKNFRPEVAPVVVPLFRRALRGMTFRCGVFFFAHCILAVWAALNASTAVWALIKGVGFTGSMVVYAVVESLLLRYRVATTLKTAVQEDKGRNPYAGQFTFYTTSSTPDRQDG